MLTHYVSEGGNLISTGMTGLYDRYGRAIKRNVLDEVFGAEFREAYTTHPDNYLELTETFVNSDTPLRWPILTWGPAAAYQPTKGRGTVRF